MKSFFCALTIAAVSLTACSTNGIRLEGSSAVSKKTALQLAAEKFSKTYPDEVPHYRMSRRVDDNKRGHWLILFEGLGDYAVPGGNILARVRQDTGEVQLLRLP